MSDHNLPSFPRVTDSPADEKTVVSDGPIFSRAGAGSPVPMPPAPVQTSPSAGLSQDRTRWAVAGVATLVVLGAVVAGLVLAGSKPGTPSTVARYAPADSAAFIELRLDLPGDQHDRVATFLSHFPGFADQAAFDTKLDETINQLLEGNEAELSWPDDIKPWFGGEIGFFSSTINPDPGTPPSMTVALSVKDRAALQPVLDGWTLSGHSQPSAAPVATQDQYEGVVIYTKSAGDGEQVSVAATDDALVVGARVEDVKRALDVHADRQPGLADDQFFLQQLGALHADHVGLFYYDGRGTLNELRDQLGDVLPGVGSLDFLMGATATRTLAEVRAEADHLTLMTRSERPTEGDFPPLPANRSTTLAESAPADGLVYLEMRDVGQTISFAIDRLITAAPQPSGGGSPLPFDLSSLETLLGTPPQDFVDFLVDVALSASYADGVVSAGAVATVDDQAVAEGRVARVVTVLRSLMQFGGGVTFEQQQHGDAELTVMTISGLPIYLGVNSAALTVHGGRLYLGTTNFVTGALDRTRDRSLAARPEYQAALQAGGTANAGVTFVDIAAIRALAENFLPAEARAAYEVNTKPFVAPFSHLAVINTTEGTISVNHVFLYVE